MRWRDDAVFFSSDDQCGDPQVVEPGCRVEACVVVDEGQENLWTELDYVVDVLVDILFGREMKVEAPDADQSSQERIAALQVPKRLEESGAFGVKPSHE